jgi:hypothetical protein
MSDESYQEEGKGVSLPAENAPQSQDVKNDPKPENKPNPPSASLPNDGQKNHEDSNDSKKWKSLSRWEQFERVFKVIEFLGIIGASVFVVVQWGNLKITNQDTEQTIDLISNQVVAAQGQLKAMQSQSDVMQGQRDEMKRTRELDERAWVAASGTVAASIPVNGVARFTVTFRNTGKTPAINFQGKIVVANNTNEITAQDSPSMPEPSLQLLAPNDSVSTFIDKQAVTLNPGRVFYLYGTAWYDDIFGKHHWSQFCFKIRCDNNAIIYCLPAAIHHSCDDVETNQTN